MLKILFVMAFSVILVSCSKSDDNTGGTATTSGVKNSQVPVVSEEPAVVETAKAQEEAAVAPKTIESAPEQAAGTADGESVYKKACISCHMTGAANAPKVGDADAWAPRIAKGMDAMVLAAINGVPNTAMPAKGTCLSCTEEELQAAIEFMIQQSM